MKKDLEQVEDEEVKDYILKIKEAASFDANNPDDVKKVEELFRSNPKVYKPVMSIKSEEVANRTFLKSFEKKLNGLQKNYYCSFRRKFR